MECLFGTYNYGMENVFPRTIHPVGWVVSMLWTVAAQKENNYNFLSKLLIYSSKAVVQFIINVFGTAKLRFLKILVCSIAEHILLRSISTQNKKVDCN